MKGENFLQAKIFGYTVTKVSIDYKFIKQKKVPINLKKVESGRGMGIYSHTMIDKAAL